MPPLVGVAVNVTVVPEQIVLPVLLLMETDGVMEELTVIVIVLLLAVVGDAQVALLVKVQVTVFPLASVLSLNVALLLPALLPFTFHW